MISFPARKNRHSIFHFFILLAIPMMAAKAQYLLSDTTESRITDLIARMTLEEKIALLGGTGFETKPIERLGIPVLNMTDGPVGVRWEKSTAFPVSIAMAATWNPGLVGEIGKALALESKAKNRRVLLGPCVNINRVPHAGRNFESFGEDPFLAARMTVAYVQGVQSEHVAATTKHFAANNQEWERTTINARIDERTLHEIYFPAFKAAVTEAGTWSVMSAYNKLNGAWCSENRALLNDVLKILWDFKGFVVSDWGAVHSTVPTANAGLDVEMPTGEYFNEKDVRVALAKGEISESALDDKVRRLLRVMSWTGLLDGSAGRDRGAMNTEQHRALALEAAQQGIVLLKNDRNVLPLDRTQLKSVAIIGPNAAVARTGGGGSSMVYPVYAVDPLDGIRRHLGNGVTVRYEPGVRMEGDVTPVESSALRPSRDATEPGLKGEYFDTINLSGTPAMTRIDRQIDFDWAGDAPAEGIPADSFSVRWTGVLFPPKTDRYELSVRSDDGARLFLNNTLLIDNWSDHAAETRTASVELRGGEVYDVRIEFYENGGAAIMQFGWNTSDAGLLTSAVDAARESDAAIVVIGTSSNIESEGFDRTSLELPRGQAELIKAIAGVNQRTIVVLVSGAPVLVRTWIDAVPALVQTWFGGQEEGNALADVLLGNVNPSGRLPVTFPKRWEDSPAYGHYPGKDGAVDYTEGIFVGYRHFDTQHVEPEFPFGHGLSYTTFTYENLRVEAIKTPQGNAVNVALTLRNTGTRAGAEVAQVYMRDAQSSLPRPVKELKAFSRVSLEPGESREVFFTLHDDALAYYDPVRHDWVVEPGMFEVLVGSSSRLIRFSKTIEVR